MANPKGINYRKTWQYFPRQIHEIAEYLAYHEMWTSPLIPIGEVSSIRHQWYRFVTCVKEQAYLDLREEGLGRRQDGTYIYDIPLLTFRLYIDLITIEMPSSVTAEGTKLGQLIARRKISTRGYFYDTFPEDVAAVEGKNGEAVHPERAAFIRSRQPNYPAIEAAAAESLVYLPKKPKPITKSEALARLNETQEELARVRELLTAQASIPQEDGSTIEVTGALLSEFLAWKQSQPVKVASPIDTLLDRVQNEGNGK